MKPSTVIAMGVISLRHKITTIRQDVALQSIAASETMTRPKLAKIFGDQYSTTAGSVLSNLHDKGFITYRGEESPRPRTMPKHGTMFDLTDKARAYLAEKKNYLSKAA